MRSTERTITCDRCSASAPVKSWEYGELKRLSTAGWSTYSTSWLHFTVRTGPTDLCPDCTALMKNVMQLRVYELMTDAVSSRLSSLTSNELISIRTALNKQIRKLRG